MKNNKNKRQPQMNFPVKQEFLDELAVVLEVLNKDSQLSKVTQSQFIREAVWEKITTVKQSHPAFQSLNSAEMPNQ